MFKDNNLSAQNGENTVIVKFENIYIEPPHTGKKQILYPREARHRDLTYSASVQCDIQVLLISSDGCIQSSKYFSNVEIFKLPVMLKSSLCNLTKTQDLEGEDPYNNGGYFIIKGKERVLVAQETINYNQVYIYKQKGKLQGIAEIRSIKENLNYSVLLQAKMSNDSDLLFSIPYVNQDIPAGILLFALGSTYDELKKYTKNRLILQCLQKHKNMTTEQCIEYISEFVVNKIDSSKKYSYTLYLLKNEILPHMGIHIENKVKVMFLLHMIDSLIRTCKGKRHEDDRDHICNKRVEMPGSLLRNLITALFKSNLSMLRQMIEKKEPVTRVEDLNILTMVNKFSITQKILYCFSTGNWGVQRSNYIRQGVSQILSRLSYISTVSHLCKIVVPISKDSKNIQVRQIHSTNYGFIDVVETPEGQSVGIVRSFSLLTSVSNSIHTVYMIDILHMIFPDTFSYTLKGWKVLLNGTWLGNISMEPQDFVAKFKRCRLCHLIPSTVSIGVYEVDFEIKIYSDEGRILRPVLRSEMVSKALQEAKTWPEMIDLNYIVYIDGNEAESAVIAMVPDEITSEHEYCEIHPSLMLGICSSMTPFSNHSQAPRNVYVAAMMKQAMGMYSYCYADRFDTIAHILNYPQKRLVTTKISEICHMEEMPSGMNAIVAVLPYGGYNQEDCIIMNQDFIERGGMNSMSFKTTSVNEIKRGTREIELIEFPPINLREKDYNYSLLDSRGIVKEGSFVRRNDVLVGKVLYSRDVPVSDCSLICKTSEEGIVNRVLLTTNASGYKHIKVKIHIFCIPEIGDKFCQVSAQKGTIGMVYKQEDMPFTQEGITPDIIINPHAFPSRMTINMLLEMQSGKVCALKGSFQDASPFDQNGLELIKEMEKELVGLGYEAQGKEILMNGFTGEPFEARIFIGPAYYQRLKHLVANKIHARNYGNIQLLSRQPCAGRSREGGLRYGEMERDCSIVHGISGFLKERMFDLSDAYSIRVCSTCGFNLNSIEALCPMCQGDLTSNVFIPYACKLLFQELQAMGIKINIKPSKI
jgi:DNA-directed RNA polymerase II subunit RPB2